MCCSCCAPFGAFFRAKFPFLAWPFSDLALFESRPLPLPAYRKKTLGGRGLVFSNSHLRLRAISCPCPKKSPIDHPFSMAHPLRGKPWKTHLSLGGSEDLVRDITARTWVCRGAKQLMDYGSQDSNHATSGSSPTSSGYIGWIQTIPGWWF